MSDTYKRLGIERLRELSAKVDRLVDEGKVTVSDAYKLRREIEQLRELSVEIDKLVDEWELIEDTLLGCSDDVSDAIWHEVRCGAVTSPIATRIKKVLDDLDAINGMFKAIGLDIGKREEVQLRITADDRV